MHGKRCLRFDAITRSWTTDVFLNAMGLTGKRCQPLLAMGGCLAPPSPHPRQTCNDGAEHRAKPIQKIPSWLAECMAASLGQKVHIEGMVRLATRSGAARGEAKAWAAKEDAKGHACACGCGGRVRVTARQLKTGVPKWLRGHQLGRNARAPRI
jgi:hypothetical protein